MTEQRLDQKRDLSGRAATAALLALVVLSALARGNSARGVRSPWIMPDELIYSSLGRSLAASGDFAIRGVHTTAYSLLYPLFLAGPFSGGNPASDYDAAKWLNATLLSVTAVPVFLIARRLLPNWLALVATALSLLIPSLAYAGVLMTEDAFYPIFLFALLAIVRAVERPSAARQLAALGAIAIAYLTRAQGIVLVPVFLIAIVLVGLGYGDPVRRLAGVRRELRAYLPSGALLAVAVLTVAAGEAVRGSSPTAFLGTYASTVQSYPLARIPRWVVAQLADLEVYLGFLPFMPALYAGSALLVRKGTDRPRLAVAATSAAAVTCTTTLVAVFSAGPGDQASSRSTYPKLPEVLHERYLFYLAPLFLIFFVTWIHQRREFSDRRLGVMLVVGAVLPFGLPFAHLLTNADFEALALLPWHNKLIAARHVPLAMAIAAAGLTPLLLVRRRSFVLLQIGLVAAILWFVGFIATHEIDTASVQLPTSHLVTPSWIDAAVPPGAAVAVLWKRDPRWSTPTELGREHVLWRAEFFNRSVDRFYYLAAPMHYGLPETRATLERGHVSTPSGTAIRYLLAASPLPVDGRVIARDRQAGLLLYRLAG